jgi:subfamily B ATP-binding cassette protein MsbA
VSPLPRLLGYSRRYSGRFVVAFAAMLLYAAASAAVAYLIKPIIDDGLAADRHGQRAARSGHAGVLVGRGARAYLAKGIGAYFSAYLMTDIGQRVVRDLRDQLFRHILNQSAAFFSRWSTGPLMSRITNDVNLVQQAVSETVGDLLREGLSLFGYAALLFWWDWRLALVCVTGAPIVVYPLVRLGQRVRRSTRRSQEAIERLSHIAAEAFTGHRIVKAFGAEEHESQRFKRASELLYRINLKITSTVAMLPPLMELLGGLAVVGLIWYGSGEISQGRTTQGSFLGFIFAAFMMYTPIKKLSRVNTNLQQAMAASERIFTMLDTHTEVGERPDARPLKPTRASVEFQNVAFAYDDGHAKYVLRDVSFCVDAGQLVAVVGLSGAGKTTLLNLIPRFYDVTAGAVLIDGTDIRDVTLKSLREQIGIVTQETVLFDDTIAVNIAYASPGASQAEIEAAARVAHAHEFILAQPKGYQTRIGERGQKLSGGQRQRIAIARALLKNAPILILDEATSALDAESEQLVQDALIALMQHRTAFVIAHRLSTVRRADKIVVLEKGRIVEIGQHDDLLAKPEGVYAKLYARQAFGESEAPSA